MICGANLNFDSLLSSITSLETDLLSGIAKDALALKAELEASLTGLVSDLISLMPELPTIPSISLQTEIQALLGMAPNSLDYLTKLASLKADFEDALIGAGQDLLGLISGGADALLGGLDPCSVIPNFEMDALGGVVEKAQNVLQAQIGVAAEALSEIADSDIEDLVAEIMEKEGALISAASAFAKSPPSVVSSADAGIL
jgi:hypothetical protein